MNCDRCPRTFDVDLTPAALVFGPPEDMGKPLPLVPKAHLCPSCWCDILDWLSNPPVIPFRPPEGCGSVDSDLACVACGLRGMRADGTCHQNPNPVKT